MTPSQTERNRRDCLPTGPVGKIGPTRRGMSGTVVLRNGRSLMRESTLERDFAIRKDFFLHVLDIIHQPVAIPFTLETGRSYRYTPDFLVVYRPGNAPPELGPKPELVEVKLARDAGERHRVARKRRVPRAVRARAGRAPTRGLGELLAAAGCDEARVVGRGGGASIEQMGVEERTAVLDAVAHLMALGPKGLPDVLQSAGVTREGWCEGRETVPGPLVEVTAGLRESVNAGPRSRPKRRRRSGPRPRHEVRQMMARLERAAKLGRGP